MRRALVIGTLLLFGLLFGCEASSRLEPSAPLADLEEGAIAQLCRFTFDLTEGVEDGCVPYPRDVPTCLADPPWDDCPAAERIADVASWEDCVRAANECRADAELCWHVACTP